MDLLQILLIISIGITVAEVITIVVLMTRKNYSAHSKKIKRAVGVAIIGVIAIIIFASIIARRM